MSAVQDRAREGRGDHEEGRVITRREGTSSSVGSKIVSSSFATVLS